MPLLQSELVNAIDRFWNGYDTICYDEYRIIETPWREFRIEFLSEASVAVTPIGLVFIYPTGLADCMAAGTVFLNIPYEALNVLLNPAYFPSYTLSR